MNEDVEKGQSNNFSNSGNSDSNVVASNGTAKQNGSTGNPSFSATIKSTETSATTRTWNKETVLGVSCYFTNLSIKFRNKIENKFRKGRTKNMKICN